MKQLPALTLLLPSLVTAKQADSSEYLWAMAEQGNPQAQAIPHGEWTPVVWGSVPNNTTNTVLAEDNINWLVPDEDAGLWSLDTVVWWENTGGLPYHIREVRLMSSYAGSPFAWPVKTVSQDYNPLRGYEEIGSKMSLYAQPGFDPKEKEHRMWVEVRQFSGQTINIVPMGIEAPLIMAFRVGKW